MTNSYFILSIKGLNSMVTLKVTILNPELLYTIFITPITFYYSYIFRFWRYTLVLYQIYLSSTDINTIPFTYNISTATYKLWCCCINYFGISISSMWTGFGLVLVLLNFRLLTYGLNIFSETSLSFIVMGHLAMAFILNNTLKFCTVNVPMMWYHFRAYFDISNFLVVQFIQFSFTVITKLLEPD